MKYVRGFTPLEILAVVTALGLVAGVVVPSVIDTAADIRPASMAVTVNQIRQQITLHAAVGDGIRAASGYPDSIEPAWFGHDELPLHTWTGRPLSVLEVDGAPDEQFPAELTYAAGDSDAPSAWYNRSNGAFCALVPDDLEGEQVVVDTFNRINGLE